jgi:hypothetical protein
MIHHCYSRYAARDPETARRQAVAQQTWAIQPWTECPIDDDSLERMWSEEGRRFPYVRDLFDRAVKDRDPDDIVIFTNTDIHVHPDCSVNVAMRLQCADGCYAYRRDFGRLNAPLKAEDYAHGKDYPGSDLVAFRVSWWARMRGVMPDMLLGIEAWDPCIRLLIERSNRGADVNIPCVIGHERHASFWENAANRYRLRAQKYNLALAKAFLQQHGVNPRQHGIP